MHGAFQMCTTHPMHGVSLGAWQQPVGAPHMVAASRFSAAFCPVAGSWKMHD